MSKRNSFILYAAYSKAINNLTDEEAGKLFKCILDYVDVGNQRDLGDPILNTVAGIIIERVETDLQRYEERCREYRYYN